MYKIAVVGSRKFSDIVLFHLIVESYIMDRFSCVEYDDGLRYDREWEDIQIVSGGCPTGADAYIKDWVQKFHIDGVEYKEFPADWATHGKAAGPIRNSELVDYCDEIMVFYDGRTKNSGSWDVIQKAIKKKKILTIIPIEIVKE